MSLFDFEAHGYYLALDRTELAMGQNGHQFLTLAVVYQGVAIPVYCLVLNKRNSNQRERICNSSILSDNLDEITSKGILADRGVYWQ
ncbi:MAG: hypothetical protein IPG70_02695 [Moraxellaceae bacterium]|nr:hypothetical protein [Moraxellaceae bacterium]